MGIQVMRMRTSRVVLEKRKCMVVKANNRVRVDICRGIGIGNVERNCAGALSEGKGKLTE